MKTLALLLFLAAANAKPFDDLKTANRLFTADFYKEHKRTQPGNFLISPFSAEVVLALTQSGSKDQTAQELKSCLHHPNDDTTKEAVKSFFASLVSRYQNEDDISLHSANKIYTKKELSIKPDFKQVANDIFKADVENIDFTQEEAAVKTINGWIEDKTENKIHDVVERKHVGPDTAMILINTLYFKGYWVNKFRKEDTKKSEFYKSGADVVQVDMMSKNHHIFEYFSSEKLDAQFLQIPLRGPDASLVLVLPNDKTGLPKLEENLQEVFASHDFRREKVNLSVPKFKIESEIDVKEVLQKLGVNKLFSSQADLSGIAGKKGELSVGEVLQKTFIGIDEKGVEAAASTVVRVLLGSGFTPKPPKEFKADHPFIFYLQVNGVVLFAGRVTDPNSL